MITYFIITIVACAIAGLFVRLLPEKWIVWIRRKSQRLWHWLITVCGRLCKWIETVYPGHEKRQRKKMLQERYPVTKPAEVESNGDDDDEDDE